MHVIAEHLLNIFWGLLVSSFALALVIVYYNMPHHIHHSPSDYPNSRASRPSSTTIKCQEGQPSSIPSSKDSCHGVSQGLFLPQSG